MPDHSDASLSAARPVLTRAVLAERLANASRLIVTRDEDRWHEYRIRPEQKVTPAAVLIPLVDRGTALNVLLTHRTSFLHNHGGQISFPGGRVEADDLGRQDTALRETEEEIGLGRDRIEVLGQLPEYEMHSGFRITPVVGWVTPPYPTRADPLEVADIFEAPLDHFLTAANYRRHAYRLDGQERQYLSVPWDGRYVWGATAGMLYRLHQLLRDR